MLLNLFIPFQTARSQAKLRKGKKATKWMTECNHRLSLKIEDLDCYTPSLSAEQAVHCIGVVRNYGKNARETR